MAHFLSLSLSSPVCLSAYLRTHARTHTHSKLARKGRRMSFTDRTFPALKHIETCSTYFTVEWILSVQCVAHTLSHSNTRSIAAFYFFFFFSSYLSLCVRPYVVTYVWIRKEKKKKKKSFGFFQGRKAKQFVRESG